MKTFGLFMLVQSGCILLVAGIFQILLPDKFSLGEITIMGILEAWCMYNLIKDYDKE